MKRASFAAEQAGFLVALIDSTDTENGIGALIDVVSESSMPSRWSTSFCRTKGTHLVRPQFQPTLHKNLTCKSGACAHLHFRTCGTNINCNYVVEFCIFERSIQPLQPCAIDR